MSRPQRGGRAISCEYGPMSKSLRICLMALMAVVGIGAVGIGYKQCVEPTLPVWHSSAKHWKVPLTFSVDPALDAHVDSVLAAADAMNRSIGCRMLVHERSSAQVRVLSATGVPCGDVSATPISPTDAAGTWLCPDGTAEVHIQSPGTIDTSMAISLHEFGHVFGLAHSAGIMAEKLVGNERMRLIDKQAIALRSRYCKD